LEKGTGMKTKLKTLAAAAALITVIISVPAVYADGTSKSPGSMMDQGGMMGQMNQMMGTCNQMMQAMMPHQQEKPQNPGQAPKKNEG
jgi:hypothetical protein